MIRLGFHMSIAGGVSMAAENACGSGYRTFQIFTSNARSWRRSMISDEEAMKFRRNVKKCGTVPYAHIPYLCNPSSPNKEVGRRSLDMLISNMESCSHLGIKYLVVHMGSHLGSGHKLGSSSLSKIIGSALDAEGSTGILLENSAGYANSVGSRFEQMGAAIDEIGSGRLGVCLDTCHAFAAGYDLHTAEGVQRCSDEFDSSIGSSRLKLVHLNDAKYPLGSGLDRHWHVGKGFIGTEGFTRLFMDRRFGRGCFIMETPVNEQGNELSNLRAAERIIRAARRAR